MILQEEKKTFVEALNVVRCVKLTPVASCPSVTRAARNICVAAIPSQTRATEAHYCRLFCRFNSNLAELI